MWFRRCLCNFDLYDIQQIRCFAVAKDKVMTAENTVLLIANRADPTGAVGTQTSHASPTFFR
jgi:hypothetical protein|tara:strand:- start:83 stop:268 length:186 start_codon:yes stop_codon:yes gene_type:complete